MAAIKMKSGDEYTGETLDIGQTHLSVASFNDFNNPSAAAAPVARNDFKVNGPSGFNLG